MNYKKILSHVLKTLKAETVLCIAGAVALISMFFTPPSSDYISYIDFRVLSLLFCLMTVVAGLNKTGVFLFLSEKLLKRMNNTRSLCYILILLCFFSAMWITNDVALITFVPFAILLLTKTNQRKHLSLVIILQTIAANLGSMLTPVGNPQNLYLYSNFKVSLGEFFKITLPITLFSLILLNLCVLLIKKEPLKYQIQKPNPKKENGSSKAHSILIYCILFVICLLCVVRLIDYRITLLIVLITILIFDRGILRHADYSLLLTFVCFFVFVGNFGAIPMVKDFLSGLLSGKEVPVSILVSQVISNVPAAVLLSAFTTEGKALIIGTNLGGLGTLIASLASLISYKLYCKEEDAKPIRYLGMFTLYNILFLILLIAFVYLPSLF